MLASFTFKGNTYAIAIIDGIAVLYTNRKTMEFDNMYQAIDWIKYRNCNGRNY